MGGRSFAILLLCAVALPRTVMAEPHSVFGTSGTACLRAILDDASPLPSGRDRMELTVSFQGCWRQAALLNDCPEGEITACAFRARGQVVAARYAAAARLANLPPALSREVLIVTALNRPDKWAGCLSDFGVDAVGGSSAAEDIAAAVMTEVVAAATCTAIFGMIDISVIEGALLYHAEQG